MGVVRFGVSLEKELLEDLDTYMKENQLANRSQAIRQLLSDAVARRKWQCDNIVAGSLTLLYDHHRRGIVDKLINIQHEYRGVILSSQHFHLDEKSCMEIVAIRGKASVLTELADKLKAVKGLQHGMLTMSRTD
jgi:CopG family transcriptional regulator, nickel-responsive regulator